MNRDWIDSFPKNIPECIIHPVAELLKPTNNTSAYKVLIRASSPKERKGGTTDIVSVFSLNKILRIYQRFHHGRERINR